MRCLTSILVAAALCSSVRAQEASAIPEDALQIMEGLVGTWEAEGRIGNVQQTGRFSCRWARAEGRKRFCLIGRFSYKTEEKTRSGVTLIGWNAAKKCLEDRGFDAIGGNGRLLWTIESMTQLRGDITMVEDGQEVKSKAVLVIKSPNEMVYEAELETGEDARFVFRRVENEPRRRGRQ